MSIEVADEAKKQGGQGDQPAATKETILESQEKPGEDAAAADTIQYFVRDRLEEFHNEMESSLDTFEGWVSTQQDDFKAVFNQRGFFSYMGEKFEAEMFNIVGGAGKPMMDALVGEVHNAVSFNEHACNDLSTFVNNACRRSTRDACWYGRDAAASILSNQWGDLMKLAANGAEEFIPALYQLGLPSHAFKPADFAQNLQNHAEGYRRAMGLKREEVTEKVPENEKTAELEEQGQKDIIQEEGKKQAVAV
ncbi:MAG: hypothetical protein EXR72_08255 [Myxococcales bacterium]|nr:hypothetical protein [Myxococcales bacterium]